ncbi:MAG: transposase domain-containing protein [Acidimicrobiales bacterium]
MGLWAKFFLLDLVDEVFAHVGRTEPCIRSPFVRVMAHFAAAGVLYAGGSYEDVCGQLTDGLS